ncbi:cell growth regulator with RING finger domain protein 1 isoform X2 [Antennarius striatus]|uniref:cell growth regulator with RING finger domain protein 1 isoform X2 n=1 Tax=Antennarius striatus TaxID=241820 RepID=UPI0035B2B512
MAAGVLVTLYEYSPLFSIGLVSLCFLVTAAIVLGWFGFDVPVILRSSEETESVPPTPEKHMVQVANPFTLEIGSGPASVKDGVSLKPCCLEPSVLTCFWGCEFSGLQRALQLHQHCLRLSTSEHFLEVLSPHCHHHQSFHVGGDTRQEHHTQIPADQHRTDFGPFPRDRYPLVAVLTLAEAKARETFNIPLFMSADGVGGSDLADPQQSTQPGDAHREASAEQPEEEDEEDWSDGGGRDCVVCQNAGVNRVLLPCRHTCVCDSCVSHFQHCPICRAFVLESFPLTLTPHCDSRQ